MDVDIPRNLIDRNLQGLPAPAGRATPFHESAWTANARPGEAA